MGKQCGLSLLDLYLLQVGSESFKPARSYNCFEPWLVTLEPEHNEWSLWSVGHYLKFMWNHHRCMIVEMTKTMKI